MTGSGWIIVQLRVAPGGGRDPTVGVTWDTSPGGAYASALLDEKGKLDLVNFGPTPAVRILQGLPSFDVVVVAVYENASEGDALLLLPSETASRAPSASAPTAFGSGARWAYYGEGRRPGVVASEVTDTRTRDVPGVVGPGQLTVTMDPGTIAGILLADVYLSNMTPASTWAWEIGGETRSAQILGGGVVGRAVAAQGDARACLRLDSPAPMMAPTIEVASVAVPFDLASIGWPLQEGIETNPSTQSGTAGCGASAGALSTVRWTPSVFPASPRHASSPQRPSRGTP